MEAMQHQLWLTKKTVQRKLGAKEDQCVVSSDSELDLKIELFESISTTTQDLSRILDLFQERISCLAMEEGQLGRFLKEHGKLSQTSGKRMSTAGKAISYSGQQRMNVRAPLIRFHSEVQTFGSRAVADTQATINAMERHRTEYRAALSWMKSITIDPDDDRGIEKFRKAQQTVRSSKERFDRKSLDCLEKIDLLAAARCNLFSHVLVAYQNAMQLFAHKTCETFKVASKILENEPHYAFTILRELTQAKVEPISAVEDEKDNTESTVPEMSENAVDHDQLLFFQDDYKDTVEEKEDKPTDKEPLEGQKTESLISVDGSSEQPSSKGVESVPQSSLLDEINKEESFFSNLGENNLFEMETPEPSSATQPQTTDLLLNLLGDSPDQIDQPLAPVAKSMLSVLSNKLKSGSKAEPAAEQPTGSKAKSGKDVSSWFKLFSELDPLANPEAMSKQINAANSHST